MERTQERTMATSPQTQQESQIRPFEDYWSEDELAHTFKRHPKTLARWAAAGKGPPRTVIGRMILYKKSSVEEWLAQQERRPGEREAGVTVTNVAKEERLRQKERERRVAKR
jgi:hypothetical protein